MTGLRVSLAIPLPVPWLEDAAFTVASSALSPG